MKHGRDVIAGLSVAGIILPEAIAYAGIAGLPPSRAIYAAIVGCLAYAAFGRSRFAIVAPTSSSAAILAAMLVSLPGDVAAKSMMASMAVILVAVIFAAAAVMKLGNLTAFISRPVLRGFALGIAITIILRQLPAFVGVEPQPGNLFFLFRQLAGALPDWHVASAITGVTALALLLVLRRWPYIPATICVLVAGILASHVLNLPAYGVTPIGMIDARMSWPAVPILPVATISYLVQLVLPLSLILFAESWGTMRALALRHGDVVTPSRELWALAAANFVSGLVRGMPVGAGFSASSANEAAGTQSRWSSAIAGAGLALLLIVALPFISLMPKPVLAAIVIAALAHTLDTRPMLHLWRLDRDQYIAIAAALGVLLFGVLNGMLLAMALSLAAVLKRISEPQLAELARLPDSRDYVDAARHEDALRIDGVSIWRPAEPLFFANTERILAEIQNRIDQQQGIRGVIVSLEQSYDIDSTALEALLEYSLRLASAHIELQLARVHDHVRDLFTAAHADTLIARSSYSVDDAVSAIEKRL